MISLQTFSASFWQGARRGASRIGSIVGLSAAVTLGFGCFIFETEVSDAIDLVVDTTATETIRIDLLDADLTVEGVSGDGPVRVSGRLASRGFDEPDASAGLHHVELQVARAGSVATISGANEKAHDVSWKLSVRLPADRKLTVDLERGDITIKGMRSRVEAETDNGNIRLSDSADRYHRLRTSSGNIDAALGRVLKGTYKLDSTFGAVSVELKADSDATINAFTQHGGLRCSGCATWEATPELSGGKMTVTLGAGSATITANTVHGNIALR